MASEHVKAPGRVSQSSAVNISQGVAQVLPPAQSVKKEWPSPQLEVLVEKKSVVETTEREEALGAAAGYLKGLRKCISDDTKAMSSLNAAIAARSSVSYQDFGVGYRVEALVFVKESTFQGTQQRDLCSMLCCSAILPRGLYKVF